MPVRASQAPKQWSLATCRASKATRDVASQVNRLGAFDAVIHNAGIGYRERQRVADCRGLPERVRHHSLAPIFWTALINKPKRLVYLSSGMHHGVDPQLDDLAWSTGPGAVRVLTPNPSCTT